MWHSTGNINLQWQPTLEVKVCRTSTQTWLWLAGKSSSVLKVTFFSPKCRVSALLRKSLIHFFSTWWHAYSVFPPLDPLTPAQQLFTGEAAGSKPMRGFMQIECARYFDESRLPKRKFELVDAQWWYMWSYPNCLVTGQSHNSLACLCSASPQHPAPPETQSRTHVWTHTHTQAVRFFSPSPARSHTLFTAAALRWSASVYSWSGHTWCLNPSLEYQY